MAGAEGVDGEVDPPEDPPDDDPDDDPEDDPESLDEPDELVELGSLEELDEDDPESLDDPASPVLAAELFDDPFRLSFL